MLPEEFIASAETMDLHLIQLIFLKRMRSLSNNQETITKNLQTKNL
jgi:hypothetical protein